LFKSLRKCLFFVGHILAHFTGLDQLNQMMYERGWKVLSKPSRSERPKLLNSVAIDRNNLEFIECFWGQRGVDKAITDERDACNKIC